MIQRNTKRFIRETLLVCLKPIEDPTLIPQITSTTSLQAVKQMPIIMTNMIRPVSVINEGKRKLTQEQQARKRRRGMFDAATALASLSKSISAPCPNMTSAPPSLPSIHLLSEPIPAGKALPTRASREIDNAPRQSSIKPKTSSRSGDFAKTFPEKLMDMLDDDENRNIISWMPDGKSFVIKDPFKLTSDVMHRYHLRRCKFESFTRKLYFWGFRKISQGKDADTFYNKLFQRGNFPLCRHIRCPDEIETLPNPATGPFVSTKEKGNATTCIETKSGREKENQASCEKKKSQENVFVSKKTQPTPPLNLVSNKQHQIAPHSANDGVDFIGKKATTTKHTQSNMTLQGLSWSHDGFLDAEFSRINNDMMQSILLHRQRHRSITTAALSHLSQSAGLSIDPKIQSDTSRIRDLWGS